MPFKEQHTLQKRKEESNRIRLKYPDRVPIICERAVGASIPLIDKTKFLCPADLTMGQFAYVIRKRIKLPSDQALFLFFGAEVPPASTPLSLAFKEYGDEDGFLYVTYQEESTFGA